MLLSRSSLQARASGESASRGRYTEVERESTLGRYRLSSGAIRSMQFLGREDFSTLEAERRAELTQIAANEAGRDGPLRVELEAHGQCRWYTRMQPWRWRDTR